MCTFQYFLSVYYVYYEYPYSMLVYYRYISANIETWEVEIQPNIFPASKQPNNIINFLGYVIVTFDKKNN